MRGPGRLSPKFVRHSGGRAVGDSGNKDRRGILGSLLAAADLACYGALAIMAFVVTADVLSRYLFGASLRIAEEVASLGLVCLMFLSLAATFRDQGFLRIDAIYGKLRGLPRRALLVVFHLVALAVTAVYTLHLAGLAWDSFERGTRSDMALATPKCLPQSAMVVGMGLLTVVIVVGLVRVLRGRDGEDA